MCYRNIVNACSCLGFGSWCSLGWGGSWEVDQSSSFGSLSSSTFVNQPFFHYLFDLLLQRLWSLRFRCSTPACSDPHVCLFSIFLLSQDQSQKPSWLYSWLKKSHGLERTDDCQNVIVVLRKHRSGSVPCIIPYWPDRKVLVHLWFVLPCLADFAEIGSFIAVLVTSYCFDFLSWSHLLALSLPDPGPDCSSLPWNQVRVLQLGLLWNAACCWNCWWPFISLSSEVFSWASYCGACWSRHRLMLVFGCEVHAGFLHFWFGLFELICLLWAMVTLSFLYLGFSYGSLSLSGANWPAFAEEELADVDLCWSSNWTHSIYFQLAFIVDCPRAWLARAWLGCSWWCPRQWREVSYYRLVAARRSECVDLLKSSLFFDSWHLLLCNSKSLLLLRAARSGHSCPVDSLMQGAVAPPARFAFLSPWCLVSFVWHPCLLLCFCSWLAAKGLVEAFQTSCLLPLA